MTDIREIKDKLYAIEQDDLTPEEAAAARKDLLGLFIYLANHGFTEPFPSLVRLMEFLDNVAASYDCPVCHGVASSYGCCSHCGDQSGRSPDVVADQCDCGASLPHTRDSGYAYCRARLQPDEAPICKSCGGSGRVQVPCPSGMPGCLVYHAGPCPECSLPPAK